MNKTLIACLALGAQLVFPSATQAAYLDVEYSYGFFSNPTEQPFATGLPLSENLSLQLGFDTWVDIGMDGFDSLLGEEEGDLFFSTDDLILDDYVLPGADSAGYAIYRPQTRGTGSSMAFYRYDDWEEIVDSLVYGEALWIRIDSDNFADGTPRVTALLQLQVVNPDTSDPLAQTFYNELMTLTDDTGYLYLEGAFNNDGFAWLSATLTPTVPEPAHYALGIGCGLLLLVAMRPRPIRRFLAAVASAERCASGAPVLPR